MNTILLNDTRSDEHIGCELVVTNSFLKCSEVGLKITATISTAEASQATELLAPHLPSTKLVLLNGEGTLHDDKPNALSLLEAAKTAKDAGCVVVLYNALWSNNPIGKKFLTVFDLIFCRDKSSLDEILRDLPSAVAEVVPDMTFATQLPRLQNQTKKGILVTDSVRKKKCLNLAKFAIKHRFAFAPMSTAFFRKLKGHPILKWQLNRKLIHPAGSIDSPDDFLRKILSAESIVTGRFHTACLSLLCQTPVYCISSNTRKIQSLLEDFGLDSSATAQELPKLDIINGQWQEHIKKKQSTQIKVAEAASRIHVMFESIRGRLDPPNIAPR